MTQHKKLRVFISAEMEGISGVVHTSQTQPGQPDYNQGRALMVGDVNAAVEGALEAGATEVVVADSHASMRNLPPEKLHKEATLIRGGPRAGGQMAGLDAGFDAALMIGYHCRKGTLCGILDHTGVTRVVERISVNGQEVGEVQLSGAIAGYHHVPVVFLSGDTAAAREAEAAIPGIVTVEVKEALSRGAARCLHPELARQKIHEGVVRALAGYGDVEPLVFSAPVEVLVSYTNTIMADAVALMPSAERVDGRTVRFALDDYLVAVGAISASVYIATAAVR